MFKSTEAMVDITLDAMLAVATIAGARHHKRAQRKLTALCADIEQHFGLGEQKLESWRRFPVEQLLRSEFRDEGVHPIQGLRKRLENLKCVANGEGDIKEAEHFCIQLNRMFLNAWSSESRRRSLAA